MNNEDALPLLSGAGGYWQVIDEVADQSVIQQQDRLSCGPACAEMLLRDVGITNIPALAAALNQVDESGLRTWIGGVWAI